MPLMLCQTDSYRREVDARVLSCEPEGDRWAAVLDRTVLYPEGGGQPSDAGQVGEAPVLGLSRREDGAVVHHLGAPVDGEVRVTLDWTRRYDHMQQHTAQHLLTAVIQDRFGFATTAFHLGSERCDIELDTPRLTPAQLAAFQEAVNAEIRAARPVRSRLAEPAEFEALGVRTRGLPEGFEGQARLVEIEGVDLNTCGGTHLSNTAEIQAIALTGWEGLRGGCRLYFLAGGRVLDALGAAQERERALSAALSVGPAEQLAAAERLLGEAKAAGKERKALLSELAGYLGRALAAEAAPGRVAHLHRDDGDMGFLSAVAGEAARAAPGARFLLTAGAREGVFVLLGEPDWVAARGPRLAEALEGRGGGRGRYQGKAARLDKRGEALALLQG